MRFENPLERLSESRHCALLSLLPLLCWNVWSVQSVDHKWTTWQRLSLAAEVTGEPKGVMLSHFNIDSNVEGVAQVFHIGPNDRLLGILPFFHSFGYLANYLACSQSWSRRDLSSYSIGCRCYRNIDSQATGYHTYCDSHIFTTLSAPVAHQINLDRFALC